MRREVSWPRRPVLECRRLSFGFTPSSLVFKDIDINAYEDEVVAIVGPTGTGKSTLLRVIAHLMPPTHGKVLLEGAVIRGPTPYISLIHQSIATFPWMTALDNVKLSLIDTKIPDEQATKMAEQMLGVVGLKESMYKYPKEMSGGMRQRIAIARALAAEPYILLLDEPFVHLDEFTAENLRHELYKMVFEKNNALKAAILVSHDLHEVVQLADRVYVVRGAPATVVNEIRISMRRPRSQRDPKFFEYLDILVKELDLNYYKA